ncbi:MAG: hypothetical protein WC734_06095 [Patescibacteria group bacterium]|jgi:hypothetical protein
MMLLRAQVTVEGTVIINDGETAEKAIREFARVNSVPVESVISVNSFDIEERIDGEPGIRIFQRVEKKPIKEPKPNTAETPQS